MRPVAFLIAVGAFVLAALSAAPAYAQLSENGGPVSYSADNLEYFDGEIMRRLGVQVKKKRLKRVMIKGLDEVWQKPCSVQKLFVPRQVSARQHRTTATPKRASSGCG